MGRPRDLPVQTHSFPPRRSSVRVVEDRVQRALTKLGVPGRDDLTDLSDRVEELTAELRRQGRSPARRTGARKATVRKSAVRKDTAAKKKAPAKKAAQAKKTDKRATTRKKTTRKTAAPRDRTAPDNGRA